MVAEASVHKIEMTEKVYKNTYYNLCISILHVLVILRNSKQMGSHIFYGDIWLHYIIFNKFTTVCSLALLLSVILHKYEITTFV